MNIIFEQPCVVFDAVVLSDVPVYQAWHPLVLIKAPARLLNSSLSSLDIFRKSHVCIGLSLSDLSILRFQPRMLRFYGSDNNGHGRKDFFYSA
jgi:hypothetical protein